MLNKEELLKKFLNNSCSEDELRQVMDYIKAEPTLIEEMLSQSEWDDIDMSRPLSPKIETAMRKHIFSKIRRPIPRMSKSVWTAAAILVGLTLGLFVFNNYRSTLKEKSTLTSNEHPFGVTDTIENQTTSINDIKLPDHSTVSLYPGSSIEFTRSFTGNRIIRLKGKAIFEVIKNHQSPFVVYSGAIRTTALGTRFMVDNLDSDHRINVKLYEGRVVVQAVDATLSTEQTFLDAGEQCFVDIQTMQVKVEPLFTPKSSPSFAQQLPRKVKPAIKPVVNKDELLHFSKTAMPEVFEKLQLAFNQPIFFNREEVAERYFTGSFSMKDSLSVILRMISVTSDLHIGVNNEGIIVVQKPAEQAPANKSDFRNAFDLASKMKLDDLAPQPEPVLEVPSIQAAPQIVVIDKNEVSYNSISLPDLLQELQKQTKKTIHYNRTEIANINFTGSILLDVNMRNTLSMICRINGLTLQVKQGSYYIIKDK